MVSLCQPQMNDLIKTVILDLLNWTNEDLEKVTLFYKM